MLVLSVHYILSCSKVNITEKMSYVKLPSGLIHNEKKVKLNLPKNCAASEYIKRFPYLDNTKDPKFQNDVIDIVNNRADLRKFLLATSDFGKNI